LILMTDCRLIDRLTHRASARPLATIPRIGPSSFRQCMISA